MAGLADWLEDYRNWRGRQEWEQGKGWQDFFGGDPRAQEQFEKLSGFGTDAGVTGLAGIVSKEGLNDILRQIASKGIDIEASANPALNRVTLSKLIVPTESRGEGLGSSAMQDLINYADEQNALTQLSPSTDFGATSINRLKDFYKRFGFVPNTGKYKDYSISESMYRPKK